jgi:hypothetical protein
MFRPQPLSPPSSWGIEGSRLHHWLPRPSRVPNFHRAGIKASTLCLMYLRPPWHHKGVFGASLKCSIYYSNTVFITKWWIAAS